MSRPVIGITTMINGEKIELNQSYIDAISDLGGVPLLLAKNDNEQSIKEQMDVLDALYLTGGSDINPSTYDEEPHPKLEKVEHGRDEYEISIIKIALEKGLPILGVCRGSQLLNSLTDGKMYQDLEEQYEGDYLIQHRQQSPRDYLQHTINIDTDSQFYQIIGTDTMRVNSHHHQANKSVDMRDFKVTGRAPDGVIEVIESINHDFVFGLQFHPEDMYKFDESAKKFLQAFIDAAAEYKKNK